MNEHLVIYYRVYIFSIDKLSSSSHRLVPLLISGRLHTLELSHEKRKEVNPIL